jgi:hypothetical protein
MLRAALYLVIMYQLPNRVYYVQFVNMDAAKIRATIINVLLYCMVELVSLVVLDSVLRRKLRFSTLRQLAFVLDRQVVHVQSALIVWVLYTSQVSLDHYGRSQPMDIHRKGETDTHCDRAVWWPQVPTTRSRSSGCTSSDW